MNTALPKNTASQAKTLELIHTYTLSAMNTKDIPSVIKPCKLVLSWSGWSPACHCGVQKPKSVCKKTRKKTPSVLVAASHAFSCAGMGIRSQPISIIMAKKLAKKSPNVSFVVSSVRHETGSVSVCQADRDSRANSGNVSRKKNAVARNSTVPRPKGSKLSSCACSSGLSVIARCKKKKKENHQASEKEKRSSSHFLCAEMR